jgi:hypothetical protein
MLHEMTELAWEKSHQFLNRRYSSEESFYDKV